MSILSSVQGVSRQIVRFPNAGLIFEVRSVTSADLAEHQVAGLVAAAGKRNDPEAEALTAEVLKHQKALQDYVNEDAPLELAAAATQALTQLRAYRAREMGPDKARAAAERQEGLTIAGVVRVSLDGETWKPCTMSRDQASEETDEGVVLNMRDAASFVPALAMAIQTASLKEADAVLGMFPATPVSDPAA
tara:strand:- start:1133 stop:1705 length:573 start_codon:yes stop_codon:yes gene_type:complete